MGHIRKTSLVYSLQVTSIALKMHLVTNYAYESFVNMAPDTQEKVSLIPLFTTSVTPLN